MFPDIIMHVYWYSKIYELKKVKMIYIWNGGSNFFIGMFYTKQLSISTDGDRQGTRLPLSLRPEAHVVGACWLQPCSPVAVAADPTAAPNRPMNFAISPAKMQ